MSHQLIAPYRILICSSMLYAERKPSAAAQHTGGTSLLAGSRTCARITGFSGPESGPVQLKLAGSCVGNLESATSTQRSILPRCRLTEVGAPLAQLRSTMDYRPPYFNTILRQPYPGSAGGSDQTPSNASVQAGQHPSFSPLPRIYNGPSSLDRILQSSPGTQQGAYGTDHGGAGSTVSPKVEEGSGQASGSQPPKRGSKACVACEL